MSILASCHRNPYTYGMPFELDYAYTYFEGIDGLPPIMVNEVGEYLHYPASPADIIAVLRRLPRELLDGLSCVDLKFEAETHCPDEVTQAAFVCDPYYEREGGEWLPGIYCGYCLGEYVANEQSIGLLGFVYDPAMPDRSMWETYLRFVMLSTLMHELAHHVDLKANREMDRASWIAQSEDVAEHFQERWTFEYVVPYLQEVYPDEIAVFLHWVEEHAGAPVPLTELIPEPGLQGNEIAGHALVREMARLIATGAARADTRLLYLRFLDERERGEQMLPLVEQYIREYPDRVEGQVLMATLWIAMGMHEGARSFLASLVKRYPQHQAAWLALIECDGLLGDERRFRRTCDRYAKLFR